MQGGGYDQGFHLWNPAEFTQISSMKSTQNYKSKCFSKNSSVWWMQGGGYDQGFHLWNPAEFTQISSMKSTQNYKSKCFRFHMKSTRFHEICWISKLWAFAWWSSIGLSFFKRPIRRVFAETSDFIRFGVDFTWIRRISPEIHQISYGFHEIHWISYRFHEIRRISCEIERPLQGIVTLCLSYPDHSGSHYINFCNMFRTLNETSGQPMLHTECLRGCPFPPHQQRW